MTSSKVASWLAEESMITWMVAMATFYDLTSCSRSSFVDQSIVKEYCQFKSFVGACANDEIVMITSGQYGRMRSGLCIAGEGYIGCSSDVTGHLESLCTGRRKCDVSVSSLAKVIQPCKRDFVSYLEAGYLCVKVANDNRKRCPNLHFLPIDAERGLLSSSTLTDESKVGSSSCPWRLKYKQGQQIRLVLVVYKPGQDEQASNLNMGSSCPWLLVFEVERVTSGLKNSLRRTETEALCGRTRLNKLIGEGRPVGDDSKHPGDIHLDIYLKWQGNLNNVPVFTIEFEVIGCPDEPSWVQWRKEEVTYKRNGDEMMVKCRTSKEIFYLTCSGSKWLGEHSNCSSSKTILIPQKYGSTLGIPFPQGVIVAVVLGLILGLIIGSASLAILFMLRRRKRRSRATTMDDAGDVYRTTSTSAARIHSSFDNIDYPTPPARIHQNFILPPPPPSSSSPSTLTFESAEKQLRSNYFVTSAQHGGNRNCAPKNKEVTPNNDDWTLCTDAGCARQEDVAYRSVQDRPSHQFCCHRQDKNEIFLLHQPSPVDLILLERLPKERMETNGSTEQLLQDEQQQQQQLNKLSANLPDCAVVVHNKTKPNKTDPTNLSANKLGSETSFACNIGLVSG